MARRNFVTNHELMRMRLCANAGLSATTTARIIGRTPQTVRDWAAREGLQFGEHTRLPVWELPYAIGRLQALMAALT
jgi:hypothetical protein